MVIIALLNHDKHWAPFAGPMRGKISLPTNGSKKTEALHKHQKELIPLWTKLLLARKR